ncbi:MAG: BirA bifunctional protein, putative [Clostridiales bacterium 38_11]|nr:MAG: BirA bifunctional protein, putative [Clostridiales bacterium 38_11]HBH13741.1 biotin--[acetyl-CoA-carboxylase] ligase [Clostridiales bacterium]
MKKEIIRLLEKKNDFISGEEISNHLGVSRAAIWKHIKSLKEEGYEIESFSRKGYRLIRSPDLLTQNEISKYLDTSIIAREIIHFDTIASTNTKSKEIADKGAVEGSVIISEEQSGGRGRLGRQWTSPKHKGIWMSVILRPQVNPIEISIVTQVAAAAVVKAGRQMGYDFYVKWPNDIMMNDKKVCGILTEMSAELNHINYVVIGIGVNVNLGIVDFPDDLREKASSIKIESGIQVNRQELCAYILNHFERLYGSFVRDTKGFEAIDICREKSILIGKDVSVIRGNEVFDAFVLDLNPAGELVIRKKDGTEERLFSGEVSVRGMRGYAI